MSKRIILSTPVTYIDWMVREFYGAITLESEEPLGNRIVTMLDVALRGIGDFWDRVETFNTLPISVQHLVSF